MLFYKKMFIRQDDNFIKEENIINKTIIKDKLINIFLVRFDT